MNTPEPESDPVPPFILRIPGERFRAAKPDMVAAARVRGQKLAQWMIEALERQAETDCREHEAGRYRRRERDA